MMKKIKQGELLVSQKHKVYAGTNEKSIVGFIMMSEFFKNYEVSFDLESQYKASNMDSFEMAHIPFEVFEMVNASKIQFRDIDNLFAKSLEQNRILSLKLLENPVYLGCVSPHSLSSHFLSSSGDIALPLEGSLDILFNFSMYSFFKGSSSTGCQSIFSQNSSSSLDNSLLLMNSSKILLLLDSSLATSDQFTHGKRSNLSLNLSPIGVIKLAIYNTPLACNFSNSSSLFLIPSFMTSGQLMSGCLSNFSLNSLDTDTVNLFIFNAPHNCSSKHKCVDVYKPFGKLEEDIEFDDKKSINKLIINANLPYLTVIFNCTAPDNNTIVGYDPTDAALDGDAEPHVAVP